MFRTRILAAAAALGAAMALSACSDSSESGDAGSVPEGTATGAPSTGAPSAGAVPPQGPPPTLPPGAPNPLAALQSELMQIQMTLQPLQGQAMADPALQAEGAKLEEFLFEKMKEADPKTEERQDRLVELQQMIQTAQAEGDSAKAQELFIEGSSINQLFQQTRTSVMQDPVVVERLQGMEDMVLDKMRGIQPDADSLIARANSIVEQLNATMAPPAGAGQ